jgi:hypothetical protein
VTEGWQEVVVPLDRKQRLDWSRLGGITFEFTTPGEHVVFIDDISFKRDLAAKTPSKVAPSPVISRVAPPASRKLWVWSTRELLRNPGKRAELFRFCHEQHIGEIWTQLIYTLHRRQSGIRDATVCTINKPDDLRALLRESHEHGIRVHALDGYPDFALRTQHDVPLAVVDAVISFNDSSSASARFDGIHFDNEPYLIVGWQDAEIRERILQEFLELNAECQRRVRELSKMEYGIDIPF